MSSARHIEDHHRMVGRVLGGSYRIVGLIDRGGHGRVYAAEHVRIGTPLAVKMLVGASAHDDGLLARFAQEAEILACLRHPHVVSILDFDFVDGQPYFVMERLEGETLYHRLHRMGALSLSEAVRIAVQIGSGLAAAHEAGIVHRDLKPGNVFLVSARGEPDFVKLLDFGISRSWRQPPERSGTQRRDRGQIWGTPHYMAPEQASGQEDIVDARTDQFALAVVIWEMLTASPPFLGDGVSDILMAIMEGGVPHLDEDYSGVFPPTLDAVLARGMAQQLDDRYPDVVAFVNDLQEASGLPRCTMPPPFASPSSPGAGFESAPPRPQSSRVALRHDPEDALSSAPTLEVDDGPTDDGSLESELDLTDTRPDPTMFSANDTDDTDRSR
jgi:serine/threonine-protein kinase